MKFRAGLSCGVALAAVMAGAGAAWAADFTIANGQIAGSQVLSNPGDRGLIEAGGAITAAGTGVYMNNTDQRVTNNGDITISGAGNQGIVSEWANAQINNHGKITTLHVVSPGIFSFGKRTNLKYRRYSYVGFQLLRDRDLQG